MKNRPAGMTITMHTCRGNFKSAWVAEGGYEPVAEAMFSSGVDGFFMEFDSARAGGFEPLRFVPKGKKVVLGLVSIQDRRAGRARTILKRKIDAGREVRAAREPVPVAAVRLLEHAPRQPPDRGRAVAQARARGAGRQGGMEMNENEILGLEDKRFAAMVARDFAALEKMVHDELLYTHSSGVTDTKASWLESMKSGKVKYKSASCSEPAGEVLRRRGADRAAARRSRSTSAARRSRCGCCSSTPGRAPRRAGSSPPGSPARSLA